MMEKKPQTLPKGWATERLGNILPLSYGKALSGKNRDGSGSYPVYGSSGIVGCHTEHLTRRPCIIVGRKGSAGNVFYSEKPCWPIDTAYYSEESSLIELRYFLYLLSHIRLDQVDNSTAIPSLSRDVYNQIEVPFAPFNEQKRIVDKIEMLFSDLDKGEENLRQAQQLLSSYRQSVLRAAVTGELTRDWREANKYRLESGEELLKRILKTRRDQWQGHGKYKEPLSANIYETLELPEGWTWASVQQICEAIVDCPHSTPKWTEEGEICIRTTEFLPGNLNLDKVRFVSKETYKARISRLEPKAGDVLYSREGGILGIACTVPPKIRLCLGQRMMLMRACISGQYLMHVLNSPIILGIVIKSTAGSAAPHINVGDIKRFAIPFPSTEEQIEIVSRLEDTFSQISALEAWCATELTRSATLRQSILKAAFSGQLVPQDASDEPASELLKRIQAERTSAPKAKAKPAAKRGRPGKRRAA